MRPEMHHTPLSKSDDPSDVCAIAQDLEAKLKEAQQHLAAWQEEANTGGGLSQAHKVNLVACCQASHIALSLLLDQCDHWHQCRPTRFQLKMIQKVEHTTYAIKDINHQIMALANAPVSTTTQQKDIPPAQGWRLSTKGHKTQGSGVVRSVAHFVDAVDASKGNKVYHPDPDTDSNLKERRALEGEEPIPNLIAQWMRKDELGDACESMVHIDEMGVVHSMKEGRC